MVDNQVYSTTKISPFIANYGQELRIGADIKRKEKIKKAIKFVEKIKKVQEEAEVVFKKVQKEIK